MSDATPAPLSPSVSPAAAPLAPTWADPARAQAFAAWLARIAPAQRLQPGSVRVASADASFRRYFRLDTTDGATRIVMDAPPAQENSAPFVHVAGLMQAAGLPAPQVLDWDEPQGFMLLTDLGARTMMDEIDRTQPEANRPRYLQAVDLLIDWQRASRPGVLPAYDEPLLRRELQLFPDWYIARHRQATLTDAQQTTLARAFDAIVAQNLAAPSVYVHRDFMMRNLMVGADERLGVLDFQDAVYGPVTYDIASLMRDAFISWEEDFVIDITVRYWEKARRAGILGAASGSGWGADFGDFYRAVDFMALQRHLKVAGIFARLTLRDGKPKYLADAPRFIAYIRQTAGRYRELSPLLRLVDELEGTQAAMGYAFGRV